MTTHWRWWWRNASSLSLLLLVEVLLILTPSACNGSSSASVSASSPKKKRDLFSLKNVNFFVRDNSLRVDLSLVGAAGKLAAPHAPKILLKKRVVDIVNQTIDFAPDFRVTGVTVALSAVKNFSSSSFACQARSPQAVKKQGKRLTMPNCELYLSLPLDKDQIYDFRILQTSDKSQGKKVKHDGNQLFTIRFHRQRPSSLLKNQRSPHTCSLTQDCNINILSNSIDSPCGLQPSLYASWPDFQNKNTAPLCDNASDLGGGSGQWLLPCDGQCSAYKKCDWKLATWQPTTAERQCRLKSVAENVDNCFRNLTIVVIGDSTIDRPLSAAMSLIGGPIEEAGMSSKLRNVKLESFYYHSEQEGCGKGRQSLSHLCNFTSALDAAINWLQPEQLARPSSQRYLLLIGTAIKLNEDSVKYANRILCERGLLRKNGVAVVVRGHVASYLTERSFVNRPTSITSALTHNRRLLKLATQLGFTAVDALAITLSRWKEFYGEYCECQHYPKAPDGLYTDKNVGQQWLNDNSILRAETQAITAGICLALNKNNNDNNNSELLIQCVPNNSTSTTSNSTTPLTCAADITCANVNETCVSSSGLCAQPSACPAPTPVCVQQELTCTQVVCPLPSQVCVDAPVRCVLPPTCAEVLCGRQLNAACCQMTSVSCGNSAGCPMVATCAACGGSSSSEPTTAATTLAPTTWLSRRCGRHLNSRLLTT